MYSIEEREACYGCSMTGVRRVAIHNPGAVIIFHSPMSCGQIIREKDSNGWRIFKSSVITGAPIITTNIENNDVIFGAHKKLKDCIEYVAGRYKPEYILIGNSCVSGIIGDDIESIAQSCSNQLKIPIFTVHCYGFLNGGYETGVKEASRCLIEAFVLPQTETEESVTLVGIVDREKNFEYAFIDEILKDWHIDINCIFPGYASVQEMKDIGRGKACILCSRYNMVHAPFSEIARKVSQKTGIPLMDLYDPIGFSDSLKWISDAGNFLKVPAESIAGTIRKQKQKYLQVIYKYKSIFAGATACILFVKKSSYAVCLSWFRELLELVNIDIRAISFSDTYSENDKERIITEGEFHNIALVPFDNTFSVYSKFNLVFTFRMNEKSKTVNMIAIPYVNPVFGSSGLETFYYETLKIFRKGQHRNAITPTFF